MRTKFQDLRSTEEQDIKEMKILALQRFTRPCKCKPCVYAGRVNVDFCAVYFCVYAGRVNDSVNLRGPCKRKRGF